MITLRRAIRSVLRCAWLSRRAPASITSTPPRSTSGEISVPIDDPILNLEDEIAPVVATVPDDPGAVLPGSTLQIPRPVCQEPEVGSMQWWGSHAWTRFDSEFLCGRCGRIWPEQQDPANE
jgi:hypothetical protein